MQIRTTQPRSAPGATVSSSEIATTPVDLTFAGRAYDNNKMLSYGYAFEQRHSKRAAPPLTPELLTDNIPQRLNRTLVGTKPPCLENVTATKLCGDVVEISGSFDRSTSGGLEQLEVFVDGVVVTPTILEMKIGYCSRRLHGTMIQTVMCRFAHSMCLTRASLWLSCS
jgi:hypothetical protein